MKIYNSLTRTKEEFIPLKEGEVKMYVCGPTVYDQPHIGHARSAYAFDVIRRYLATKYVVKFARNVTDVDDKIIDKARKEYRDEDLNAAVKKVAEKYLAAYHEDMDALGIQRPDHEPKATAYVEKKIIQNFIQVLIEKGAAYQSGGDVYFDIKKARRYGKLSNQSLEKMDAGARIMPGEKKRDPLDFALWKSVKEDEPSWESPWGRGRPGWHIECSAMSSEELGDEFDIHGGGIDLIFPHHENEVAQSEGAGKKFARFWMHNGLLTINSEKMAKSLGNYITIKDFLKQYEDADLLKLLFLGAHYRHPVDYTEEKILEMRSARSRFEELFKRLFKQFGTLDPSGLPKGMKSNVQEQKKKFDAAMDDDLNTPLALGIMFTMISECNKMADKKDGRRSAIGDVITVIYTCMDVLGLDREKLIRNSSKEKSERWDELAKIFSEAKKLIEEREQLRKEKKFKEADERRKALEEKGIILKDTKDGTEWRKKD
ncbi:MAG: cysteine--tRNA ligase [Candidatus Omnitrophota bacterium]